MKKTIFAMFATFALAAAPAVADTAGVVGGVFGGTATSHSSGGSISASGGLATGGNSGSTFVRNEQSAGQLSGAYGSFTRGDANGTLTGTLVTETFTDGFSQSRNITRNNGSGSVGIGAGFSTNWGSADAAGAFGGIGAGW